MSHASWILLRSVAVLLQVVGGIAVLFGHQMPLSMVPSMVVAGGGGALLVIGAALHQYVKKSLATQCAIRLGSPAALPSGSVLYLRPFDTDGRMGGKFIAGRTYEENVLDALRRVGPAVALGRPGEEAAHAGALRVYHDDPQWQAAVEAYLGECALCVIMAGNTPGLEWELSRCIARLPPEKLLVFIPRFDNENRYSLLCQQLARLIPHAMPAYLRGTIFVRFDLDWCPHLLCERDAPHWMVQKRMGLSLWRDDAALYEVILAPVFVGIGIPYETPERGPSQGFGTSLLVVIAGFFLLLVLMVLCGA